MLGTLRQTRNTPVKRDEALRNLSREHNHALLLARAARRAAAGGDAPAIRRCWESLLHVWNEEMATHFDTEERLMIPVLREAGATKLAERLLREHRAIRRTLTNPERRDTERLAALAEVLRAHVRREEREAFPLVEQHADSDTLIALARHPEPANTATMTA
jgi:iron-sulfur cluster repair protein YtfE (RIC family)